MEVQNRAIDTKQQDIQSLGFFGIFKESYKVILSSPKIFIQIMLAFILPEFCISLCYSMFFSNSTESLSTSYDTIQDGSSTYDTIYNFISNSILSGWDISWFLISMILSLNAISAIVNTVACIYSGEEITFKKVLSVSPNVWKRLVITNLFRYFVSIAIEYMLVVLLIIILPVTYFNNSRIQIEMAILVLIIFMTLSWELSDVVLVLENCCGLKALKKSKELIKGKLGTAFAIYVVLTLSGFPMSLLEDKKLAGSGIVARILEIISLVLLSSLLTLFGFVAVPVFYMVCKSDHHESIDKAL